MLLGALSKVPFIIAYHGLAAPETGIVDFLAAIVMGLRLDVAIAGYITLLPGLLLIVTLFWNNRVMRWVFDTYFVLISFVYAIAVVTNIGLYGAWGFPLNNTPVLYLKSSPADAMASITPWQIVGGVAGIVFLTVVFFLCARWTYKSLFKKDARSKSEWDKNIAYSVALLALTTLLIIPIRGGFGTGTNHTGVVYASSDMRVNHAAVNPIFSFVESVTHRMSDLSTMYHVMEASEAEQLTKGLYYTALRSDAQKQSFNVVIICLESFSRIMMETEYQKNGKSFPVTPNLNRLSKEGMYFTNFYANSVRTDRALVCVLSGLPSQPDISVMDMPQISTFLPSIARTLGRNGYHTAFYYGGDTNFCNMNSYMVGTGYQNVTSETDFPKEQRTGKWGVADGPVYKRMLDDIAKQKEPFFYTIMTESSHEPFDVPNYIEIEHPVLNAFSYADKCLGDFIAAFKKLPAWQNTLVVIVPDHLGAYPEGIDNYDLKRYHTPLIMTGGVIKQAEEVTTYGSQIDISATVLAMLGLDHSDFTYSKDMFDAEAPHFAYIAFPDAVGILTDSTQVIHDNNAGKVVFGKGKANDVTTLGKKSQAYLQRLFDDIGKK